MRSHVVEGFYWAQRLLERSEGLSPALRARALSSAGCTLGCYLGNYADADRMSREALDLARLSGDKQTVAAALYARGAALVAIDPKAAHPVLEQALQLFQELDDRWECAQTLNLSGELVRVEGDYRAAGQFYHGALTFYQQIGNPWGVNIVLQNLGYIAEYEGDYKQAATRFTESLSLSKELNDKSTIAAGLVGLGGVSGILHEPERAARLFGSAEALREAIGTHVAVGDQADYDRNVKVAQAQLDESTFQAAWADGRAMTLEQALAEAFEAGKGLANT